MEEDCEVIVKNAWGLAGVRGEDKVAGKLKTISEELHTWS
jgi:hypothetical protein